MNPNHPLHPPPSSPVTPPGHLMTYYLLPPGVYQTTHQPHDSFNTNWGPVQQQQFLYHVHQMAGGVPSPAGAAVPTSGYRCLWLTAAGLCNQGFAEFDTLMTHLSKEHDVQGTADKMMYCQWWTRRGYCGKECRRDGMRRHIGTHVGCSYPCTECGKPFSRRDSMRAHEKKQHGKQ